MIIRGPNFYGWVGLISIGALSLYEQSFWPIAIFLIINGVVGLTALFITMLLDRRMPDG